MTRIRRRIMTGVIVLTLLLGIGLMLIGCHVSFPGRSHRGPLPALTDDQSDLALRLRGHVEKLAGEIGERHFWRPEALEAAAAYVDASFRQSGYEPVSLPYRLMGKPMRNIEVTIEGTTEPPEIVVIGAHYDSVRGCPGANDNATGTAAVLEMARLLKDTKPGRTIRLVAFVNEETPFFHSASMGSVIYAKHCKTRGDNIVAMFTPETIGFYSDERGSQRYPFPLSVVYPSTGNFIAFVGNTRSRSLVSRGIKSFRTHVAFPSEGAAVPGSIEGVGWSDHWSFWQEGWPAFMVTDTAPFRYPHYHEPTDTPDKIDYDRTARVVAGLARVAEDLANE